MKDHEIRELVNQLRDVAIKYHGAGQLREQIARTVRAAIIQAQSDGDGEPTDDERIMAIEGIHNCERCGDEGWIVGEMGITRCACGQAGNSPVIPDGYVMVPKEPTEEMNKAGWAAMNEHDAINPTYRAMLAAAPAGIPMNSTKWIPVSERMPETDGNYWGWWSESKRQGPVWFIKSELQAQFQSHEITHWMPLPAAPQNAKPRS